MVNPAASSASERLGQLLQSASAALVELVELPLAIASARNKFNDAREDDYWCAVQSGQYHWEQSQFFGSSAPGGLGVSKEGGSLPLRSKDYASAVTEITNIDRARHILKGLDSEGWHELAESALGAPRSGMILALAVQFDQVWLHCSHPAGAHDNSLYALVGTSLLFCGNIDDRFDERVGKPELIRCDQMSLEALPHLSDTARAHFGSEIVDKEAEHRLASLAHQASAQIRLVVGQATPVALTIKVDWKRLNYPWAPYKTHHLFSEFAIGIHYYDSNYCNILKRSAERSVAAAERLGELEALPLKELDEISKSIDHDELRRLFERATGVDTFDYGELRLLTASSTTYILHHQSLYHVAEGGLTLLTRSGESFEGVEPELSSWIRHLDVVFREKYRKNV